MAQPASPPPQRDIHAVLAAHQDRLMAINGVVGVYVGLAADDKTECIKVMLASDNPDTRRALPRELEGHCLIPEVTGEIRPLQAPGGRAQDSRRGTGDKPVAQTQLSRTAPLTPSPTRRRSVSQPRGSSGAASFPLAVVPGDAVIVEVLLSPIRQTGARRNGNPPAATANVALAVPRDFDPGRAWPILIICGSDPAATIETLPAYQEAALPAGWIILAAEGQAPPVNDTSTWRLAMIGGALDYLAQQWPGSTSWPIAVAGVAAGAERAPHIAAALTRERRRLTGLLLIGIEQDTASAALQEYRVSADAFRQVPIFLSNGEQQVLLRSLRTSGFENVRAETSGSGAAIHSPHLAAALRWFAEQPR